MSNKKREYLIRLSDFDRYRHLHFKEKGKIIKSIIIEDGGPKKMKNAQLALINLFDALTLIVNGGYKNAA